MKVLFINYADFTSPSGMHIFHLANQLAARGVACTVYSPGLASSAARYGRPRFVSAAYPETKPRDLALSLLSSGGEYLIHAWTPREKVRFLTEEIARWLRAPRIVHMEDNEEAIAAEIMKFRDPAEREDLGTILAAYREFLRSAQGYTAIIEELMDFCPPGLPAHVFWPACEEDFFSLPEESSPEDKAAWGIPANCLTLLYPGGIHASNAQEVKDLFSAVLRLQLAGLPTRIIRFGYHVTTVLEGMYAAAGHPECLVDLTASILPADLPRVMRAVDVLVQPGRDSPFNKYRFPCKLPMFLASGRPVILPATNLGRRLEHGKNCLLLREGSEQEIYACVRLLADKPDLARTLGRAGREYARAHFSWERSAAGLLAFYERVLADWRRGKEH
ncbi:MAG: glycosyltransferase family 4 protein [Desulfovibrio sp.]|nr:glycosyltransferase family 4 protein [Desulfovibrio sp.]